MTQRDGMGREVGAGFRIGNTCTPVVGTGESGLVLSEEGNPAGLSSCSGSLRPLVELCVDPAGFSG